MTAVTGKAARLAVAAAASGLLLVASAGRLRAEEVRLHVGIGGGARAGSWSPVVIDQGGGPVHVWAEDPDGQLVRSPAAAASAPDRSRFQVRFGRPQAPLLIESTGADGRPSLTRLAPPAPLPSSEQVLLVVGDLPAAERTARLLAGERDRRLRVVKVATPQALAAGASGMTPRDFDGIDAAIVCGTALTAAQDDALAQDAVRALDGWVQRGGRLVFIAGAESATAAADASVARWLPGPPGTPGKIGRAHV